LDLTNVTLENVERVLRSSFNAWYPPGESYGFTWAGEESGVYKGKPYYKPGAILVSVGEKRFLIRNVHGALNISQEAKHLYAEGRPITEAETLATLDHYFQLLLDHIGGVDKVDANIAPNVKKGTVRTFLEAVGRSCSHATVKNMDLLEMSVNAAIEEPSGYFRQHQNSFKNRGIDKPRADLYQFVLLDGLIERSLAAEIDWKCDMKDMAWNIKKISGEVIFETPALSESRDTAAALILAAQELQGRGKYLVQWDINSDSYVLVIVPSESLRTVISTARELKLKMFSLLPEKDPKPKNGLD